MNYKNIEWISVQDAIPEPDRAVYYKAKSVLKHEDDQHTPRTVSFITHDTVVTHWAYVEEEKSDGRVNTKHLRHPRRLES